MCRTYRLKKYTRCFVGLEAVQWLVNAGAAADDEEAVFLGNQMLQLGLLHHVKYKHPFKNRFLFYRYGTSFLRPTYVFDFPVALVVVCSPAKHGRLWMYVDDLASCMGFKSTGGLNPSSTRSILTAQRSSKRFGGARHHATILDMSCIVLLPVWPPRTIK